MTTGSWFLLVIYSALCNNVLLSRLPAAYPEQEIGKSAPTLRRVQRALALGAAGTVILAAAQAVVYPVYQFVLLPAGLDYMLLPVAALATALMAMLAMAVCPKCKQAAGKGALWVVLASVLMVPSMQAMPAVTGFAGAMASAVGAGLGYLFALVIMAAIEDRLEITTVPAAMRGTPILMVATALVGMAFMGFLGLA